MKERPILFKGAMVLAILDGRKTQTRRVIQPQPTGELRPISEWSRGLAAACHDHNPDADKLTEHSNRLKGKVFPFTTDSGGLMSPTCPYGQPGDKLWVREAWRTIGDDGRCNDVPPRDLQPSPVWYEADGKAAISELVGKYRPPMFMLRWASRITLEITNVRVERLQEISNDDAFAEGINRPIDARYPVDEFRALWGSINATRGFGWDVNSWVWVVEFRRIS